MSNYVGVEPGVGALLYAREPIGMIGFFHAPPDGSWVRVNGQTLAKLTYPDLWAYAQGFLTADQVASPGLYKDVDAANFAVPKLDGLFIRAQGSYDANRTSGILGALQADANLSHFHTASDGGGFQTTTGGPSYGSSVAGANAAATTNSVGGTEARPANVGLVPCVKALRTVIIPVAADAVAALAARVTALEGGTVPFVTASGTAVPFVIPPGVKKIWLNLFGISTNGASPLLVQVGDSVGGLAITGYHSNAFGSSNASLQGTGTDFTTGFALQSTMAASHVMHGMVAFVLAGNLAAGAPCWTSHGGINSEITNWIAYSSSGMKTLNVGAYLNQIRLTTVNGTDTFDGGQVGVRYE